MADPPTDPPSPADVPPLQIAESAAPALAVGNVHALRDIPVIDGRTLPLKVPEHASVVFVVGIERLATPFLTPSVVVHVSSSASVKLDG